MKPRASWVFGDIGRLFYPQLCAGCGCNLFEAEQGICAACLLNVPQTGFKNGSENPAARIFHGRVNFMEVRSFLYFHKSGLTQRLLHQIKYRGASVLAYQLGQSFGYSLENVLMPELFIPVPLHRSRLSERGYNQAEAIARGLSNVLKVEVDKGLLTRSFAGRSQTKSGRLNRWNNVGTRFVCTKEDYPKETHFALVDDVLTTGSTLESCARALQKAGYRNLSAYTLAYAEY